jgi:hypothetical protein
MMYGLKMKETCACVQTVIVASEATLQLYPATSLWRIDAAKDYVSCGSEQKAIGTPNGSEQAARSEDVGSVSSNTLTCLLQMMSSPQP